MWKYRNIKSAHSAKNKGTCFAENSHRDFYEGVPTSFLSGHKPKSLGTTELVFNNVL